MAELRGSELAERLDTVRSGVAAAIKEAGRDEAEVTTIVVTKFHPVSLIRDLFDLGVSDFGENRHQEARAKAADLADLDLRWHFVGQLQSKKARQAREYVSVVHSLDRNSVIDALAINDAAINDAAINDTDAAPLDVFVQLNLTDDPGRGGVPDAELERTVQRVAAASALRLLGVMAVAPIDAEPREAFARVRAASERVIALVPTARFISAGMSGDYREAILEGATHLRIGSAITGNRPTPG